jgi:hypothetical protein
VVVVGDDADLAAGEGRGVDAQVGQGMTSSDIEIRSPVLTSMSYSRGGWVPLTELAR